MKRKLLLATITVFGALQVNDVNAMGFVNRLLGRKRTNQTSSPSVNPQTQSSQQADMQTATPTANEAQKKSFGQKTRDALGQARGKLATPFRKIQESYDELQVESNNSVIADNGRVENKSKLQSVKNALSAPGHARKKYAEAKKEAKAAKKNREAETERTSTASSSQEPTSPRSVETQNPNKGFFSKIKEKFNNRFKKNEEPIYKDIFLNPEGQNEGFNTDFDSGPFNKSTPIKNVSGASSTPPGAQDSYTMNSST